jgi:diacylglycerol kinase
MVAAMEATTRIKPLTKQTETEPTPRRPRAWSAKFGDAFRGLKCGIRGESSFSVHFFAMTLVIVSATVLRCTAHEWCLLVFAIGVVLTAELFNTCLETLFRGLDLQVRERCWKCLDIAAAAVLTACITAAIVGVLVLGHRLYRNLTCEL